MVKSFDSSVQYSKGLVNSRNLYSLLAPGGGYLVYFADGMCTPLRVSISPLFLTPGIEKGHFF